MKILSSHTKNNHEHGIALFMAVFALMLLSAIAAGFMYLANTETAVNANYRSGQQAYFGARAGLQEARLRITTGVAAGDLAAQANALSMPNVANKLGGIYITNPASGELAAVPWDPTDKYFDDTICKGNFGDGATTGLKIGYGTRNVRCSTVPADGQAPTAQWAVVVASTSATTGTASALPYKWVRITLKGNRSGSPYVVASAYPFSYPFQVDSSAAVGDNRLVCWTGSQQVLLPATYTDCSTPTAAGDFPFKPVFLITALAKMPSGSERTLSIEVADDPPISSNSAVYTQSNVNLSGKLTVNGYDACKCTATGGNLAGQTCDKSKYAIYSTGTVDTPNGSESVTAGTLPSAIKAGAPSVMDVPGMIKRFKSLPQTVNATGAPYNYNCTTTTTGTPPVTTTDCGKDVGAAYGVPPILPPGNPPLDQSTTNPQAPQVTYVPGNLQITNHSTGNGILIVDGDLDIHGGLDFYGLILVKGAITFTGSGGSSGLYGAVIAGGGTVMDDKLGGGATFGFDSCALNTALKPAPPRLLGSREIEY